MDHRIGYNHDIDFSINKATRAFWTAKGLLYKHGLMAQNQKL